jgi:hypothetical protein
MEQKKLLMEKNHFVGADDPETNLFVTTRIVYD